MSTHDPVSGHKVCSICGVSRPLEDFNYGSREGRSYCPECNKRDRAARATGGIAAAKEFREGMQAKWRKS